MRPVKAETFGELIITDHLVRRGGYGNPTPEPGEEQFEGARQALAISDNSAQFLGVYTQGGKNDRRSEEIIQALQRLRRGPTDALQQHRGSD